MVRRRDGSIRFVLAYRRDEHSAPFGKLFFVGVRKGEDPRDPNVQKHRFEILANGTHWVMEGPHAKGAMHYWENEINPVEVYNEIPLVTKSNAFALHADLLQNCGDAGLEFIALGGMRTAANRAPAVKIEDPKSPLLAKDLGLLARAIKAIDINDPKLADYDTWCTLFRAMWAACGGDRAFYADHILPWLDGNPQNLEDDMEAKLASFRDSQVGAEHIYWWAAQCGHPEFYEEYRGEYAKAMFDALPVDTSQAGGADGSAGGSPGIGIGAAGGSGSGGTGSQGPTPQVDNHDEIAEALAPLLRSEWRFNVDAKQWLRHINGSWSGGYHPLTPVRLHCATLARQILATVQGPAAVPRANRLKSYGTWIAVVKTLESMEEFRVTEEQFDEDPWLLNTPAGYVDLRDCKLYPHDPDKLMRRLTGCAPDIKTLYECLGGLLSNGRTSSRSIGLHPSTSRANRPLRIRLCLARFDRAIWTPRADGLATAAQAACITKA